MSLTMLRLYFIMSSKGLRLLLALILVKSYVRVNVFEKLRSYLELSCSLTGYVLKKFVPKSLMSLGI